MDAGTQAAIQVAVGQTLAQAQLPGATIAIHTAGQPALALGIGHQDRRQARPLPREARFYLYSITKCLIAAAVMGHARAADLSLDAPIQDYWQSHWPEFPVQTPVTLRQILSHTSGLPDYGGLPAYHGAVKTKPQQPWSAEQFLAVARSRGLLFEPGTGWSYSNLGYLALKLLLEQSLGQPLQAILAELFFAPLGLAQTGVVTSLAEVADLTPGYSQALGDEDFVDMSQRYHPGWVSHGVVVSTAAELAALVDALMTGQLLDPALVEQMAEPVHSLGPHPPLQQVGCGLGLFSDTASPYGRVAGHNGGGPGYSTAAFHFSTLAGRPTTIAAATNQEGDNVGVDVVYAVARVLAAA